MTPLEPQNLFYDPAINRNGVFMRYFDGLTLPDVGNVMSILNTHANLLGGNADEAIDTLGEIIQGVRSFVKTREGLALSHALYCVDLAHKLGAGVRFVLSNGLYKGTILDGKHFALKQRGSTYMGSKTILREQVSLVTTHQATLIKVAAILSPIKLDVSETLTATVTALDINTPRKLHVECSRRVIDEKLQGEILVAMKNLDYTPIPYWNPISVSDVTMAIRIIGGTEKIPGEAPFCLRPMSNVFTKDKTLSCLHAFGAVAPTFSVTGGTPTKVSKTSPNEMTESKTKATLFKGLPVYTQPVSTAKSGWDALRRENSVSFKKNGSGLFIGQARTFKSQDAEHLWAEIKSSFGAIPVKEAVAAQKRKREIRDEIEGQKADKKKVKVSNRKAMDRLLGLSRASVQVVLADDDDIEME